MVLQRLHTNERIFTLAEWAVIYDCHPTAYHGPTEPSSFKVYTLHDSLVPNNSRFELFHLTDYVVSSISAGVIWLVERSQPC